MTDQRLEVGDMAYCLLFTLVGKRSRSGARQQLRGAATVRIEAIDGDAHRVVVLRASGGIPDERLDLDRVSLYAVTDEVEAHAFRELVAWYWPSADPKAPPAAPTPAPPLHPMIAARAAEQLAAREQRRRGRREQLELGIAEEVRR